jgi:Na+/H+ antiporter NhaA
VRRLETTTRVLQFILDNSILLLAGAAIIIMGVTAGIGFTVAVFFTTAAFPPGAVLDEAKMGALLSILAAPIAIGLGRILRIGRLS